MRRRPYAVVLLDEIEKAHPDVFNLLLQVLEDGRLTDSQGRAVDFKNTVIIMTSNIGAMGLQKSSDIGFRPVKEEGSSAVRYERMKNKILEEIKHIFRPEFLNRVDEVVVFHSLDMDQIKQIVTLELAKVVKELENQHMTLEATEAARELIAKEGWDPAFGARPLRRAIGRLVEDPLSEELLRGTFKVGDHILLDAEEGKSTFRKIGEPLKPPVPEPTETGPANN